MDESATALPSKRWPDDLLNREGLAEFLTKSLVEQSKIRRRAGRPGLTVALDADWGTGKSFFTRHWADDLIETGHPVVFFDAWENDIGDEAVVSLMSSIKVELEKWTARLPAKTTAKRNATIATKKAIAGLRRAIIPASKVVATGLLKKATGIAVGEIFQAMDAEPNDLLTDASEATSSTLEAGLDELFKQMLDTHQRRASAITTFKSSICTLIDILETEAGARTPVFVFVDEVDRCRPTYAIRLLEEIKHIFGIDRICFVVSTNLPQLQESVRAIYGSGFDGHRYLKRFFDYEYMLPDPDHEGFAAQLLSEESALNTREAVHGLPARPTKSSPAKAVAIIATAFGLDLRSKKQVFSIAGSVAAAVPETNKVFLLWLFFLCAMQHRKPSAVEALQGGVTRARFVELCQETFKRDVEIPYTLPNSSDPFSRSSSISNAKLSEVLWNYYEWSRSDLIKLRETASNTNLHSYPASNVQAIAEEAPSSYRPSERYPPSISRYIEWVRYAGMSSHG